MGNVKTVTILFTDLVGSTSLESQVGPTRADELRREHFALLREAIDATAGEEVKNTGDGLMAAFDSAAAATDCAIAMQQRLERRNRGADEQLSVRIGISMGDVTQEVDDYFGMPVNEAARLCDKATGGAIFIPELVRLMVGRRGEHSFRPAGALDLKGIPEPVEAYEVTWEPLGEEPTEVIPLPRRLVGVPPLSYVGREVELEQIGRLWESARAGERRVGLVGGEPGIGKTRTITHVALQRHAEGATVLYGRSEEDLATPYGLWIEALGHYVTHAPTEVLETHVERYGGDLARLLPGLSRRAPAVPEPKETDPETERYLLFAAVVGLLGQLTTDRQAILLLDDLHWADKPTLALLKHLIAESGSMPLLILGAYRHSELPRHHPLADTLADLRREQGVERISLDGLGEPDVVAIMEATAGHEMDAIGLELAREIAAESSGNPFFVAELLRHLTESGVLVQQAGGRWQLKGELGALGLPQSVREVIGRRVERLGEAVAQVLTAAAVIGRDFDVDLLSEVVAPGEEELLDLLEVAVEASVLVERSERPGAFSFAHALINHTLYEDLGATRRARLHQQVAEALEKLYGDDPGPRVAELANHWAAATAALDPGKAVKYSRRAGERALETLAPDEAMRWYRRALELQAQQAESDAATRCDLLIGLGEAQRQTGDREFRETLLEASALAREIGDGDRLARSAIANNRGFMSAAGITDQEVISALEAALKRTAETRLDLRATLLSLLALELIWAGDLPRRLRLGEEALELARRSGDERTLAWVLWRRFNPIAVPETLAQRSEDMKEMEAISERLGDPVLRYWAALYGSTVAFELGDRQRLDAAVTTLREKAEELGQPVPRWAARWIGAVCEFLAGRIDDAERLAEEAAQVAADSEQPDALTFYTGQLQQVRWAQGRLDEVTELMEQGMEDNPDLSPYRALVAFIYCETGRKEEARALLDDVAADVFSTIPRDMLWLNTMVEWAEVAADTEHAAASEALFGMLEPWSDQFPTMSITVWMPVCHYLGRLAVVLGRLEDAERSFARALELEEGLRAPLFAAETRLAWGAALLDSDSAGANGRGEQMVRDALAAGRELGIARIERRAVDLLASASSKA